MGRHPIFFSIAALLAAALLAASVPAQSDSRPDPLLAGFLDPPASTKPWVYWYWATDNVSREGITRDLEAMAKAGIGEAFLGIVDLPEIGRGSVKCLSEEWWGLVEHAVREAGRVGVDLGIFNGPGWSQSGGPWVKPEQSMRRLKLSPWTGGGLNPEDVALIAFPTPAAEIRAMTPSEKTESRGPPISLELNGEPFTARSLRIVPKPLAQPLQVECELSAADESGVLKSVRKFTVDRRPPLRGLNVGPMLDEPVVISFPATTSSRFRLAMSEPLDATLSARPGVERYVEKQLGSMHTKPQPPWDAYAWPAPAEPDSAEFVIDPKHVIDLTKSLQSDGTLAWDPPDGDWTILRVSVVTTGATNVPCSPEARGLEVDKMNRAAVQAHFDAYVGKLLARMPAADRKAIKHVVADSWEVGPQNWTDGMRELFQQRSGYDPIPWLPVLDGWIVGSAEKSDRFLWDLRRLVADRIATEYVGGLREAAHQHGLELWLENYGHWGFPAEFLQYGGQTDRIAGEFWADGDLGKIEMRAAASCAHVYGKNIISAEAFTGGPLFRSTPGSLAKKAGWAMAEGANHFVLHVFFHQPTEDKPGITRFGTEFNRHNTWFGEMGSWVDWLRSSHFLLQQGRHVADVALFIGEDAPKMTGPPRSLVPPGYDFDYVNAEVLETRMKVENGRFVLPDGTSYRLLVLPEGRRRPAVQAAIAKLIHDGGPVVDLALPGADVAKKLIEVGVPPDAVDFEPASVVWTHRTAGDAEIWLLSNQGDEPVAITPSFRVAGRAPELWDPAHRSITRLATFNVGATHTRVPLQLDPGGSMFVVFREPLGPAPPVTAVIRDGRRVASVWGRSDALEPASTFRCPADWFTVEVWGAPEADIGLPEEADSGVHKDGARNDAIFPLHGAIVFGGPQHAASGLSIGRNGIVVYEHGDATFAPVLVYKGTIAPWTQIVVVYFDGQPSLYLNGALVRKGLKSRHIVHPSPSADVRDPATRALLAKTQLEAGAPFIGRMSVVTRYDRPLGRQVIAGLLSRIPPLVDGGPPLCGLSRATGGALEAEVSVQGSYEVTLADASLRKFDVAGLPPPIDAGGPWAIRFSADVGAPEKTSFEKLISWTEHEDPAIKYFSGTAAYATTFELPAASFAPGRRLQLDLGRVGALAHVLVNGRDLGVLWKEPFITDVTSALRPGANALEVRVTNAWCNQLIGDRRIHAKPRIPQILLDEVGDELMLSGLMGPVRIFATQRVRVP